jgi:hypothetical protein
MGWSANVAVQLQAGNTIINQSGQFSYSSAPAAGNLVSSTGLAADTVDQFGNQALAGSTDYHNAGTFWVALNIFAGSVNWYKGSSEAGPWTLETELGFTFNAITGGGLVITAPAGISGAVTLPVTAASLTSLPSDNNSGSTWVSGERAFMNNNWVNNINSNENNILTQLVLAGVFA